MSVLRESSRSVVGGQGRETVPNMECPREEHSDFMEDCDTWFEGLRVPRCDQITKVRKGSFMLRNLVIFL